MEKCNKVGLLCGLGGMLEFYDFILYVLFSGQISAAFFNEINNPIVENFIIIAVFSVAYVVRPLGGIIIGYFGDKIGRKKSFTFTLIAMGIIMFLMGIMPSYHTIGITATILFISLRVLQGLVLGGELPGAIVFVYESIEKKKGRALGIMFGLVLMGFVMGNCMSFLLHKYCGVYAWRAAYISGALVAFLGYKLRMKLEETELFKHLKRHTKIPIKDLLFKNTKYAFGGVCTVICVSFYGVMISLYLAKYLVFWLKFSETDVSVIMLIVSLFAFCITIFSGCASDYFNPAKLYKFGCFGIFVASIVVFPIMSPNHYVLTLIGCLIIAFFSAVVTGTFMWMINEIFPTEIRFTGVAFGYNIAFAVVGGFAPMLSEFINLNINHFVGPMVIGVICSLSGLISLYFNKNRITDLNSMNL